MSKLKVALMSLGEPELQKLAGKLTVNLLAKIDETIINKSNLVELIQKRYGNEILLEKSIRDNILLTLNKDEAQKILINITGKDDKDPWKNLIKQNYNYLSQPSRIIHEYFQIPLPKIEKKLTTNSSMSSILPQYGLYPYQQDIVTSSLNKIFTDDRRVLVHMPTGSGKTRSAMTIISHFLSRSMPGSVIIWLAHSEELCEQASEEFEKCWSYLGNREITLGRLYSEYEFNLASFRDGVIVAGLAKIYSRSFSQQSDFLNLKKLVKLVVMDEAHQAIAPTYKHLLDMLAPEGGAALLGLSATPGRSWLEMDRDKELADFFAGNKISLKISGYDNPVLFLQEKGYLAKPEYIQIPYKPLLELSVKELENIAYGFDISLEMIQKLGEDEQRNLIILKEIISEAQKESKILVFACSVDHAHLLADVLLLKGIQAMAVSTRTGTTIRRQAIEAFKKDGADSVQVLVNFGILTTGFDAPKTNVAVIARPTQSVVLYSQMIGRAMRGPAVGGNKTCKIITVVDNLPGFRSVYEGFSHWEDVWSE